MTTVTLPAELEQIIFSIAYHDDVDLRETLNLLLVAKRVSEWITALIYGVVVLHNLHEWPPIGAGLREQLVVHGKYVRHLLLRVTTGFSNEEVKECLSQCPNVVNLALWTRGYESEASDFPDLLGNLSNLKELSFSIKLLPKSPSKQLSQVLSNITHLDAVDDLMSWDDCESLLQFPSLTHLSLFFEDGHYAFIPMILEKIPRLKVLVLWEDGNNIFPITSPREQLGPDNFKDPRVVCVKCEFIQGWEKSARGITSLWGFAEEIVDAGWETRKAIQDATHGGELL